jgi:hypothetical protein
VAAGKGIKSKGLGDKGEGVEVLGGRKEGDTK